MWQAESLRFLAHEGFDFNKLLRDGVRYMSVHEETAIRHDARRREGLCDENFAELNGARAVVELLWRAPCPVIGHNCLRELMMMVDQFLAPLPESVDDFKRLLHEQQSQLLDTKEVAESIRASRETPEPVRALLHDTSLGGLHEAFLVHGTRACVVPVTITRRRCEGAVAEATAHDAAYDAYMTGAVAVHLAGCALANESRAAAQGSPVEGETPFEEHQPPDSTLPLNAPTRPVPNRERPSPNLNPNPNCMFRIVKGPTAGAQRDPGSEGAAFGPSRGSPGGRCV